MFLNEVVQRVSEYCNEVGAGVTLPGSGVTLPGCGPHRARYKHSQARERTPLVMPRGERILLVMLHGLLSRGHCPSSSKMKDKNVHALF